MSVPVNTVRTRAGKVSAVCEFCGRKSRPVEAWDSEPNLYELAAGWSTCPFPVDHVHPDGSTGSTYACPACDRRLSRGESLRIRNEPRGERA